MHNYSYWESELYDQVYDLVIVGGGLTGQSTALFYKKENPSAKVLVVDRGFYPIGASTRNAGFACIGTIGEHISDLEIDSEKALKKRIQDRFRGLLLLRETLGDTAIDYKHTGGWEIFSNTADFDTANMQIGKFNTWMKELIGEDSLYEAVSYQGFPSIYNRCEGMLHPGKMMKALYEKNIGLGVEFRWNAPVISLNTGGTEVLLERGKSIKADKLVIATNAFTSKLLTEVKITPGRGYVFVTNEIDDLKWKGTFHYNKGYVYFRNLGEKRLLIGGGRNVDTKAEETSEFGINESIKEYLVNFVNNELDFAKGWEIEHEWSGIMGFSESKSPVLHKIGDGTLLVAGLSGMGVALGMQLGKKMSQDLNSL